MMYVSIFTIVFEYWTHIGLFQILYFCFLFFWTILWMTKNDDLFFFVGGGGGRWTKKTVVFLVAEGEGVSIVFVFFF